MSQIFTANSTKVYVSTSVVAEPADAAAYALLAWTEIGGIESLGAYGDEANIATIALLGDARIRKAKGARDAGTLELTTAKWADDVGQIALIAGEGTNFNYPFKIVLPNRLLVAGTDEIDYLIGLISSKRENVGTNDNVVRRTFNVAINSKVTVVAPT